MSVRKVRYRVLDPGRPGHTRVLVGYRDHRLVCSKTIRGKFASDEQRRAVMAKLTGAIRDEHAGEREYRELAENFQPLSLTRSTILNMSDDEARHAENLARIRAHLETPQGEKVARPIPATTVGSPTVEEIAVRGKAPRSATGSRAS